MRIRDNVSLAAVLSTLFITIFALLCRAEESNVSSNADYVAGENSQILVTPELQSVARQMLGANGDALLRGVALTMQKYDNDMQTQTGRRGWHGRMMREEVCTNGLYKIEVYSNDVTGAIWRYRMPFRPVTPKTGARKVTYTTNGIPERLAAARAKRAAQLNGEVVTTNITHTANTGSK